jgi:hypothetical protein
MDDHHAEMRFIALLGAGCLIVSGCSGGDSGGDPGADLSSGNAPSVTITQPQEPSGVPVAPDSERVDLTVPRFSHPTVVDNPLFPVSRQEAVVFVGHVDGKPFRTEVTLLPLTRIIDWGGQRIETLVSQYAAYLGGRIQEVAYDLYAQADDGSVWYFGEDVADLEGGAIATKEGTWLAGKDGPAQMIMPGDPQVGDVFRTENIPGIAFEQVTVKSRGQQLEGPLGPVSGMVGEELHEDGTTELKQFAARYGEFFTGDQGDVEALALAVPTDASERPLPPALRRLYVDARSIVRSGPTAAKVARLAADWSGVPRRDTPRLMIPVVTRAVAAVHGARKPSVARQAAVDLSLRALDLQLRYRDPVAVDRDRVSLWCEQLLLDARRHAAMDVDNDIFTLYYLRDRVQESLSATALSAYNHQIGVLQETALERDLPRARRAALRLRTALHG